MKKILLPILTFIFWSVFMYFLFAFTLAELDFRKWAWDARYFLSFFGFVLGVFWAFIAYMNIEDND